MKITFHPEDENYWEHLHAAYSLNLTSECIYASGAPKTTTTTAISREGAKNFDWTINIRKHKVSINGK